MTHDWDIKSEKPSVGERVGAAIDERPARSDVQALSVKVDALDVKIDAVDVKVDARGAKLDGLSATVAKHGATLEAHGEELRSHTEKLERIERLTLGLIDSVNANTETIGRALASSGVRAVPLRKTPKSKALVGL